MVLIACFQNIAGRWPENSHNNFVDLQSQKDKRNRQKNVSNLSMLYFDSEYIELISTSNICPQISFI